MNWLRWSYLRLVFLGFLQSALVALLVYPWLQLAAGFWNFRAPTGFLWTFFTFFLGILAARKSQGLALRGLGYLLAGVLLALALALWGKLPWVLSIPLTLVLFLLGARFLDYPSRRSFTADWGWGSLLLVLSCLFQPLFGYRLEPLQVVLFFALSVFALIFWNSIRLERAGLLPDYRGLGRFTPLFILSAVALAVVLGAVLSPELLQKALDALRLTYYAFVDFLVFLLVRPLAWLAGPLFRWAEGVEVKPFSPEIPEMGEESSRQIQKEATLNPQAAHLLARGSWLLGVALLLILIWAAVRWVRRRKESQEEPSSQETRESVFSGAEILLDLKKALQTVIRPWSRRPRFYRGDDPRRQIRAVYARFAVKMGKKAVYAGSATPLEYARDLAAQGQGINHEALQTLTLLYNAARYGEKGDRKAIWQAEEALRRIF